MTQKINRIVAKYQDTISLKANIGDTTATLTNGTDITGASLTTGRYGFTIDEGNSSVEYFEADVSGTALSNIKSLSISSMTETTGFTKEHRAGAEVKITDYTILGRIVAIFRGTTSLDAGTPLKYDGSPTLSANEELATVGYVLSVVTGGTVTFNANVIQGMAGETIASGDWVYLKESDGRWYKTDADDSAKSLNVKLGMAKGSGTAGNNITGGVFVGGIETTGTYSAGQLYYLSGTAGALSTTAGTNEVLIGIGDGNSDLIFLNVYDPEAVTAKEKDALAGTAGTPSSTNKYVTESSLTGYGVDQQQTTSSVGVEVGQANSTSNKNKIAQSFIPVKSQFRGVKLSLYSETGTFTGTCTISLQADSGGNPSGTPLLTKTLTNFEINLALGNSFPNIEIDFSTESTLTVGNTYWIVIETSTADSSNYINFGASASNLYANGTVKYNNTADGWVTLTNYDLEFYTLEGVETEVVETDSSGKIVKDFFSRDKMPIPMYPQTLPLFQSAAYNIVGCVGNADASVIFLAVQSGANTVQVYRFARLKSGNYKKTHGSTSIATNVATNYDCSLVLLGDYIYLFYQNTSNVLAGRRMLAADLTGATTMTVPATATTTGIHAWTSGISSSSFVYIVVPTVANVDKCSISGTTLSIVTSGTATATIYNIQESINHFTDGSFIYIATSTSDGTALLYKLTDEFASAITTTTSITINDNFIVGTSDLSTQGNTFAVIVDTEMLYWIIQDESDEGDAAGDIYRIYMTPYEKP